jgi:hypothetical protein
MLARVQIDSRDAPTRRFTAGHALHRLNRSHLPEVVGIKTNLLSPLVRCVAKAAVLKRIVEVRNTGGGAFPASSDV